MASYLRRTRTVPQTLCILASLSTCHPLLPPPPEMRFTQERTAGLREPMRNARISLWQAELPPHHFPDMLLPLPPLNSIPTLPLQLIPRLLLPMLRQYYLRRRSRGASIGQVQENQPKLPKSFHGSYLCPVRGIRIQRPLS